MTRKKFYGKELILDLHNCDTNLFTKKHIRKFIITLCDFIDMKRYGKPMFWKDTSNIFHLKGISAMQFIVTSDIVIHTLDIPKAVLINIFSCKDFDTRKTTDFSKKFWKAKKIMAREINRST